MIRLSIIIPVYKTAATLDRCVQSVTSQASADSQIILVDDGSPDCCGQLCDEWAVRDRRIRVIHKPNGGLSDARNAGIHCAKGDYLAFVDSDDYLADGTLPALSTYLDNHKDVDLLEFPVRCEGDKRQDLAPTDKTFATASEYWHATMAWNHSYAWNKIYRRTLFCNRMFAVGLLYEDLRLLPLLLADDPKVATTSLGAYHYSWNEEGISRQITAANLRQLLDAEQSAAGIMHTSVMSSNGWNLYLAMLCRQLDIYRLSGEIVLHWPLIRLVCWLHKKIVHR